jgi:hypothetical protein
LFVRNGASASAMRAGPRVTTTPSSGGSAPNKPMIYDVEGKRMLLIVESKLQHLSIHY